MQKRFSQLSSYVRRNRLAPGMMRHFNWFALLLMLAIALFGVVCIFSATAQPTDTPIESLRDMISTQPLTYARLQLIWIIAGLFIMSAVIYVDYDIFSRFSNWIYWANIALLVVVLFMERGRGNMAGWFRWGADSMRTLQPAEFGKIAIIVALAKLFSNRKRPIQTVAELLPVLAYIGLPLILIAAQPDIGTAIVYVVIFAVMLFVSGTSYKLIIGMISLVIVAAVPLYAYMRSSDSFRYGRLQVFLDPTYDPSGQGMQTTNARIALGSSSFFGKGMFSEGSFASLNYIPDDHTDFIFAIVGETFGFFGAGLLILAYALLIVTLIVLSLRAENAFGRYFIIGYMAMLLFHIVENIGMVVGLLPVTGIPLPFVSYGGSNILTNMIGYAIVLNISMRSRDKRRRRVAQRPKPL